MEVLGIGPSELFFIVLIAVILLGPRDLQKAGRTIGKWMRRVVTSDGWRLFQQTSHEIQTLPNRLMREAALDELRELQKDLRQPLTTDGGPASGAGSPGTPQAGQPTLNPVEGAGNTIVPAPVMPATLVSPIDDKGGNA
jgi:Sec-independent protein translocase protein TatA